MIRYEIRERFSSGDRWRAIAWFDNIEAARHYWSTAPFDGTETQMVKLEYTETVEHYHSANGETYY